MEEAGKKPTNAAADPLVGQIVINLFEDSFEVKVTDKVDLLAIYAVGLAIIEYLEKVGADLDKIEKIMLQ